MGLLGKIAGAGAVALGSGVAAIGKSIESAFIKQKNNNIEYMAKYPYKCKYLIREVKDKMDDMDFAEHFGVKNNFFVAYDLDDKPVYISSEGSEKGKCSYNIMDMTHNVITTINVTSSVFNSEKRTCHIQINGELIDIDTSNSFDNRSFSVSGKQYRINSDKYGKEIKIYEQKRMIAQMNKIPSDLGMKWGEYVIGFEDSSNETLVVTFGLSIAILLIESANLLK